MPTVTLSTKAYGNSQLEFVDNFLKSQFERLSVETKIFRVFHGWVQIEVSGEDEKAALHYLADEIGLCPEFFENVEKFSSAKGYITSVYENGLQVDIGVFSPSIVYAAIPLKRLQAQLVDGKKMAAKKIADVFGFVEKTPLRVKISSIDERKSRFEAFLPERQLTLYRSWTKSLLDRLIVLGETLPKVKHALKQARCNRDIVDVESLGLFEHAIVCKLGTDAVGLIPKVGRRLRNVKFSVFNPRKILAFLGDYIAL